MKRDSQKGTVDWMALRRRLVVGLPHVQFSGVDGAPFFLSLFQQFRIDFQEAANRPPLQREISDLEMLRMLERDIEAVIAKANHSLTPGDVIDAHISATDLRDIADRI